MFIKHFSETTEIVSGDRALLRELLNPRKEQMQIDYSLAWAQIQPDQKTVPHTLSYAEVYYILRGDGIMHIDDEEAAIKAQDTIYIPPHAIQWVENTGTIPLAFLCIVNPAWHPEAEQILTDDGGYTGHKEVSREP
jgi:mannose-6-phosphate isomerase-like protein (cupin superfamily)